MRRAATILGAAAIDLAGEPPNAIHPVVWMGTAIGRIDPWIQPGRPPRQFAAGLAAALAGPIAMYAVGRGIERLTRHRWPLVLVDVWVLKCCLAWRSLDGAAERVERNLATGDLPAARVGLRWLVSRDPASLDASQIAAAAIESVAENFGDSVVGPTLAYALFGLGGVLAYRWINTADAMLGYRGDREWSGKAAARLDDLVNLLPARVAAAALIVASRRPASFAIAWRDAGSTESPNAGWPMAAMAGILDRRLEKSGHYVLNSGAQAPDGPDLTAARRLMRQAWLGWLTVLVAGLIARRYVR